MRSHLTGAVHFSPQEYFDFLKENLVAQQLLKVLREFPKLSLLTGAVHFSQQLLKVLREFPKLSHYYTILGP